MYRGIKKHFKRIAAGMICSILFIGLLGNVPAFSNNKTQDSWNTISSADWMKELPDTTYLSEINLPGTHDSTTQYANLFYFSKTQDTNISEQLDMGYRYLDIRLECDKDRLKLVHGFVDCKKGWSIFSGTLFLDDVLEQCYTFLDEHPFESIVFCIKKDHGKDSDEHFQQMVHRYIEQNPEYWYLQNENPKLAEVRGKIILARRYEDANQYGDSTCGLELFWENQNNKEVADCPYTESQIKDGLSLAVQDRFCYVTNDKWTAVNSCIANPANRDCPKEMIFINFLSTKGKHTFGHPKKYAKPINANFLGISLEYGLTYGWILVDYGTEEIARHIYETNLKQ